MGKVAAGVGVLLALLAGAAFSVSTEYHHYTVTFVKDGSGNLKAEKEPGVLFYEIDYGYSTDWDFVNHTGEDIDVQFQESSSTCHLDFIPTGSVFCGSAVIPIDKNGTKPLHATARDLQPYEYCYWFDHCQGHLDVGLRGKPLLPVDPDLQIERDYPLAVIAAALASAAALLFAFVKRRRGPLNAPPENPAGA